MADIDREGATSKLKWFLSMAELRFVPDSRNTIGFWHYQLINSPAEVQGAAQVVEPLLDAIVAGWRTADWEEPPKQPLWRHREAANRAIASLESQEEIVAILGDGAPQISVGGFHPWAWESAKTLWASGHFREAVNAAARGVSAQAQSKVGRRGLSEWKLLLNAFSVRPAEAGEPRLRLMADDGSDTFKSLHDGVGSFARGAYQAIRNPANHDELGELDETEAVEQLAAFSLLARWVDEATVEVVES
ncbi:TIGR02391 family protein [Cellulosimicrobium funkei]|uniref:TIGR02391 family protein n=1 Tax=Cellulosimicrobium funkei TaxID=264251 RepID=UPI00368D7401